MFIKNIPEMKGCVKFRAPKLGAIASVRYGYYEYGRSQNINNTSPYYSRYYKTDFNSARIMPVKVINTQQGRYRLQFTETPVPILDGGHYNPYFMVEFNRPTYVRYLYANGGPITPGGTQMETSYAKPDGFLDNHATFDGRYEFVYAGPPRISKVWGLNAFTYGRQYMTEIVVVTYE
ncbi:MAG: hypothetical protein EOO38_28920 [Cytophagaceae bacterium]|nr:MAG: hypothetical protein EOO38_28920 [Cytophagaceae bacterium]